MRSPSRRHPWRLASLVAVAAVSLAACGGGDGSDSADERTSPSSDEATDVAGAGSDTSDGDGASGGGDSGTAADGALASLAGTETIEGAAFDHARLDGAPGVAWFWAPWCTICRAEGPEVAEVAEQYGDRLAWFGVAAHGSVDEMRQFVEDTGTGNFDHIADPDGAVWSAFGVIAQPAFAFIRAEGEIEVISGSLSGEALTERVDALLES